MDQVAGTQAGGRLSKCATGIAGLDEITLGGLPRLRTSLVLGNPGSGKTLLGLDFLCRDTGPDETGVLLTFEQSREQLIEDARSVGLDLAARERDRRLAILAPALRRPGKTEAGTYKLDGLLMTITRAAEGIGARRLVIDGLDTLFDYFEDQAAVRDEFLRLTQAFTGLGLSTALLASAAIERHRLEEYLSDCVIRLDHRVIDQISTRRLRVLKYRGTAHGCDEYPFVITEQGLQVFPITSASLAYPVSEVIQTTGVPDLDAMLASGGLYRGSAILLAGQTGTGKTSLASHFAVAAGRAGQRCTYFTFEESPDQLRRNMASIGLDLGATIDSGALSMIASRPSARGLEQHLVSLQAQALATGAETVVIDPITNLISVGSGIEVKAMLTRLLDNFKKRQVTVLLTSLILSGDPSFGADIGISSLMDTILLIDHEVAQGRRRQVMSILKSRGTAHSRELRHLVFGADGIRLRPLAAAEAGGSP